MVVAPGYFKVPMPPFSKPQPGTGINWDHPLSQGLVSSFPLNEMKGTTLKNYANPAMDMCWDRGATGTVEPTWITQYKVNGLNWGTPASTSRRLYLSKTSDGDGTAGNHNILPWIDFTKGLTVHFWWKVDPLTLATNLPGFFIGDGAGNNFISCYFRTHTGVWTPQINGYDGTNVQLTASQWPFWPTLADIAFEYVMSITASGTLICADSSGGYFEGSRGAFSYPGGGFTPIVLATWPGMFNSSFTAFKGTLYSFHVWNRGLGPREIKTLMQNPLQMYNMISMGGIAGELTFQPPNVTLVAVPDIILLGQSSILTWGSTYATTLTIDNGVGVVAPPSGNVVVSPLVTTTYTITATNVYGSSIATATVIVNTGTVDPPHPPPIVDPSDPDPPIDPPANPLGHFRLYQKDCEIRVKQWGSTEGYTSVKPFGGPHFTTGAEI